MKLFTVLALLLFSSAAMAAPATLQVTYKAPTACSDGGPFANCALTGFKLYAGLTGQPKVSMLSVGPGVTATPLTVPSAGNWCVDVTALGTGGTESVHSAEACMNIVPPPPPPGAPTGVTLAVLSADNGAYKMRQGVDNIQLVKIGTVPAGTQCDTSHALDGYALIPRSAISLTSKFDTLPLIAFAKCG